MIAYNKDKEGLAYLESFMDTDNTTCFSFWFSMAVSCSFVLSHCIMDISYYNQLKFKNQFTKIY